MNDNQKALICIPDISGFTEYMSGADLQNSKRVIPPLLNQLIYANTIDLKVSEIEGDAILFYRFGAPPALKELAMQCELFFRDFYAKISEIQKKNSDGEDFDNLNKTLGLKIVLHYGDIEMTKVGKQIKLIGEDVIVAHRLLKNSIPFSEYILISQAVIDCYESEDVNQSILDNQLIQGQDQYDHIGLTQYYYKQVESANIIADATK